MSVSPSDNPICYSYLEKTFEFHAKVFATESPIEPGIFHYPQFTTLIEPPEVKPNQIAIFSVADQTWSVVADFRGQTWYNGTAEVEIEDLGDPTTFTPPLTPTVGALSAIELSNYAKFRQAMILADGKRFNVNPSGQPVFEILCDGSNPTRADLALLVLNAQANPNSTMNWVDNDGKTDVLTASQVVALAQQTGNWTAGTYGILGKILAGINATPPTVTTKDDVDAAFAVS